MKQQRDRFRSIVKNIENIYFGIHIQVHYTLWICSLDLNTYISVNSRRKEDRNSRSGIMFIMDNGEPSVSRNYHTRIGTVFETSSKKLFHWATGFEETRGGERGEIISSFSGRMLLYAFSIFAPLPSARVACFLAKVQVIYKILIYGRRGRG